MTPQQANELLRGIGSEMSNVLYNLGQHKSREITEHEGELFYALAKKWDEARRAPAPTSEPGARDAVRYQLLRNSPDGIEFRDANGVWRADCPSGAKLDAILDLATPASPAVPTVPVKPFAGPGKWFAVDVLGDPMREYMPGKWENCVWPSAVPADPAPLVAQASPWISVDDRLPPVETDVLVFGKRGDSKCFSVAGIFNGELHAQPGSVRQAEWLAPDSETELRFIVAHWQPLPPAPESSPLVEDAQRIVAGKVEAGPWEVLAESSVIHSSQKLDVILKNGVCLMVRDYHKIDWTQVADWRYSADRATTGNATADDGKDK